MNAPLCGVEFHQPITDPRAFCRALCLIWKVPSRDSTLFSPFWGRQVGLDNEKKVLFGVCSPMKDLPARPRDSRFTHWIHVPGCHVVE